MRHHKFRKLPIVQAVMLALIGQTGLAQNEGDLETITIVGSPEDARNISGSAAVITMEDLETFEYTDIHKILSSVPGVNFRPEDGYGLRPNISIRGTYADRSGKITLMEDGVLIAPGPYSASSAYYFPTVGRLAGVEVLKGAAAITQGPYTIGGAINMLSTPIPEEQSGFVNQEIGENGTQRTHVTYGNSTENFGFLLEGHIWDTDGFDTIQDESGDTGFEKDDFVAKFRLNSDRGAAIYQELNFKYQWSEESSDQTYVGLADASFRDDPHERYGLSNYDNMDNDHETISLSYGVNFGQFEFDATYYENEFARDWFKVDKIDNKKVYGLGNGINNIIGAANDGIAEALAILNGDNDQAVEIKLKHNNRKYQSDGLDLRLNWSNDIHSVTVGYRDTEDSEDRFQVYEYSQWSGGRMGPLTLGDAPGYSSNNRLTEAEATAFYIQDIITLDNLTLNIGYRNEDWSIKQERYTDSARTAINAAKGYPKKLADDDASLFGIGAVYDISDEISLYAGFNEGFTPTGGGADPEEAESTEFGVRYEAGSTYIDVGYFNTDYENMFGSCTASGGAVSDCEIGDSFNAGEADISGFEIFGQHVFESGSLTFPVSLSYTATDASFKNTFESEFWGDVTSGMDIPDLPDTQLALSVGFDTGDGWSGNMSVYSFGSTCSVASCSAGTKIDSHAEVDLVVTREFSDNLDGYLTIMNVTDEEDVVARAPKNGARAQFPRAALVGIRWRF
ncbi:TonB-dependent receptor [Gammaproteobacteria bacterium]|nr:TonB-dependent receptor [Gammaproteobacteria bacterium]